jgi:hypothetical protein
MPGAVIYFVGTLKKFPVYVGMIVEKLDNWLFIVLSRLKVLLANMMGRFVE